VTFKFIIAHAKLVFLEGPNKENNIVT